MKFNIERIRRASWTYKQPLTRVPSIVGVPVSDLFIWRNSEKWMTFFELTDLSSLFGTKEYEVGNVRLVVFDALGRPFVDKTFETIPGHRNTISISSLIGSEYGSVGTFSVFHLKSPQSLQLIGSHLAERGYVSYQFNGAPLRSYVHGNLDAIAYLPDQSLQLLGGTSVRRREYNVQYCFDLPGRYELGIVNPTLKKQKVSCYICAADGKLLSSQKVHLNARASHLFNIDSVCKHQRVVMSSHLIMARPLVFCIRSKIVDVFHG